MAKKKNEIKCPYCANFIQLPSEGSAPKLKPATITAIHRIESEEIRGLLMLDKDYGAKHLVEGYMSALAEAIRRYQDFINGRPEDTPDEVYVDKNQLEIF